ncbi:MAG: TetR/AcrR family transcriptional regulator [Deferribacteres bacterium]|nr:TetR/AcrR family transcriptional regulator [Deferribacteres bacterium]
MERTDTKERLLGATLKLISTRGYLGATTREIAREAGVSELTLFRHFRSKERLFEEVLNTYTFLPRLRELLPELEGLPCDEALMSIGTGFLETLKERKSMVRIMFSEMNTYPEKVRRVHKRFIDETILTLANYFRALQDRGRLRKFPHTTGARAFLGMVFSYFQTEEIVKGRNINKKEMQRTVGEFTDIFLRGVK